MGINSETELKPQKHKSLKEKTLDEIEKQADATSIQARNTWPEDDGKPDRENNQIFGASVNVAERDTIETVGG